ncbi:hypothetical protein HanRHA438_Chr13g0581471 [Helianthus annuus]|nr:hypothetical protein HanRHA438_Chr13g0581471 [Helianthus annuus]
MISTWFYRSGQCDFGRRFFPGSEDDGFGVSNVVCSHGSKRSPFAIRLPWIAGLLFVSS